MAIHPVVGSSGRVGFSLDQSGELTHQLTDSATPKPCHMHG